jgi:excisionase family DNA binding protein
MSRLLTLDQAAKRIGVSARTLRGMVNSGEFPAPIRRNRRWVRVPENDIKKYLESLEERRQPASA